MTTRAGVSGSRAYELGRLQIVTSYIGTGTIKLLICDIALFGFMTLMVIWIHI